MSKGTVFPILALARPIYVRSTELSLVLIRMIKLFNPVVRLLTELTFWALSVFHHIVTHFRLIRSERSPLVLFLIMIVRAPFQVVAVCIYLAWLHLEQSEVQELAKGLTLI